MRKKLKYITGEEISKELPEVERERISKMGGWITSRQLPILTEKIILLKRSIDKF